MIKSFLSSTCGNIAILSGFVMLPAFMMLGAGYDLMRATANATKLRSVLESAALASASLTNSRDVETVIEDYMKANLVKDKALSSSLDVTVGSAAALNSKTVTITADAEISTFFLSIIGIDSLPVMASTIANQSKTTVELAMVLDISSSMSGSKVSALKDAASDFVDQILNDTNIEHTSMSVVPFGGTVNIGDIWENYVVEEAAATIDPDEATYSIGDDILTSSFRFDDGDKCLEHPDEDFNDGALDDHSRAGVPHFWKWRNFHPWCPGAASAALFNTNDKEDLQGRIEGMVLSDGTGMDIGMMWGVKALSPKWTGMLGGDFGDRPHPYNGDAMKVLVVMTDGEITAQFRPEDVSVNNVHGNRPESVNREPNVNSISSNHSSMKGPYGKANSQNQQTIVDKGNSNSLAEHDDAVAHFKRLCDEAKSNNIVVYTIGFQIKQNNISHELLGYCASDPSKYYFVE